MGGILARGKLSQAAGQPAPRLLQKAATFVSIHLASTELSSLTPGAALGHYRERNLSPVHPAAPVRKHPSLAAVFARCAERNGQEGVLT
jgi:hypothetical protein